MSTREDFLPDLAAFGFLYVVFTAFGILFGLIVGAVPENLLTEGSKLRGAPGVMIGLGVLLVFLLLVKRLARKLDLGFMAVVRRSAWACLPFMLYVFYLPTALKSGAPKLDESIVVLTLGLLCHVVAMIAVFSPIFQKAEYFFDRHGWKLLLFLLCLLVGLYLAVNARRYEVFGYCGQDSALYQQSLWTTLKGNFFYNSDIQGSQFGNHNNVILIFLLPFFKVFPHALTLHVFKVIFLALTGLVVYRLARLHFGSFPSVLLGLAIVCHPFISLQNFDDFNESHFGPFFFLLTFYFYYRRKAAWFVFSFLMTLFIREDYSIVLFLFSIYALLDRRWGWAGFAAVFSIFWFWLSTQVIAPMFPKLETGYWWIQNMYGTWGETPGEMVKNVLGQPGKVLKYIFYGPADSHGEYLQKAQRLQFMFYMLVPFLIVTVFIGVEWLFAVPVFFENFLSDQDRTTTVYMHYGLPLAALLMVACVKGLHRFGKICDKKLWKKGPLLNCVTLAIFAISCWSFYHFTVKEQLIDGEAVRPYFAGEPDKHATKSNDKTPTADGPMSAEESARQVFALNNIAQRIPDDTPEHDIKVFMPRYVAPHLAQRMHLLTKAAPPGKTVAKGSPEKIEDCDIFIFHTASRDKKTQEYLKNEFIVNMRDGKNPNFKKIDDKQIIIDGIEVYRRVGLEQYFN